MAAPKVRVGGSGFTVLIWRGQPLAYLQTIQDTPPQPVAQAQAIQPIDAEEPLEIVTAQAVGPGTLRLTFYEKWDNPVWAELAGHAGDQTLLDVLKSQLRIEDVTIQKLVKNPNGVGRTYTYEGCVIVDVDQGEQINIGSMSLPKTITVQYARVRRD